MPSKPPIHPSACLKGEESEVLLAPSEDGLRDRMTKELVVTLAMKPLIDRVKYLCVHLRVGFSGT